MHKQYKFTHQKSKAKLLILVLGCVFLFLIVFSCLFGQGPDITGFLPKSIIKEKLNLIKAGELRDDVVTRMTDAWHHGECKRDDGGINDVFLFGPKQPNLMDILVVTSQLNGGEFRVVRAFSEDRDVLKEYGYDKCIPSWILTPVPSPGPVSNNPHRFSFT